MSIFLVLTLICALITVWTLLPHPSAGKISRLGYRAVCSFSPISTIILLIPTLIGAALWLLL